MATTSLYLLKFSSKCFIKYTILETDQLKQQLKKGNSSLTSRFAIGKLILVAYSKYIVILMHKNFIAFKRTRGRSVEVLVKIMFNTGYKRQNLLI